MSTHDPLHTNLTNITRVDVAQGEWISGNDGKLYGYFHIRLWDGEKYENNIIMLLPPERLK